MGISYVKAKPTTVPLLTSFVGGDAGSWIVTRIDRITGPSLPRVRQVAVIEGAGAPLPPDPMWVLRGVVGHERYTTREEHKTLARRHGNLGRPTATNAALIPVSKSSAWWQLSQDERRAIFEETSHHIAIGMEYLPALHGACTTGGIWESPSTSSPGSSSRQTMSPPSRNSSRACGRPRSGRT